MADYGEAFDSISCKIKNKIVNRFRHGNIIGAAGNKRTLIAKGDYEVRVI